MSRHWLTAILVVYGILIASVVLTLFNKGPALQSAKTRDEIQALQDRVTALETMPSPK